MGALIPTIIKIAIQLLAGIGIGSVIDKVAADKVPGYVNIAPDDMVPWKPGFKPIKLLFTVVAFIIGGIILGFLAKKFKIKLLK